MAKFSGFRTLKTAGTIEQIGQYLITGLNISLRELQAGLSKLSFDDNFESQTLSVTLPANSTTGFSHNLGVIPSKRLIVRASGSTIDDGDPVTAAWTSTTVFFRNTSASSSVTATIILMR